MYSQVFGVFFAALVISKYIKRSVITTAIKIIAKAIFLLSINIFPGNYLTDSKPEKEACGQDLRNSMVSTLVFCFVFVFLISHLPCTGWIVVKAAARNDQWI